MVAESRVLIMDEFGIYHEIDEHDPAWEEAKGAVEEAGEGNPVVWPLKKITYNKGFGWWTVWASLDEVVTELEQVMPNPTKTSLLSQEEYTPSELSDLLRRIGGYLTFLHAYRGRVAGEEYSLDETYDACILVGSAAISSGTEKSKEAALVAGSALLRETKRMEIKQKSILMMLKGWIDGYERAWDTVSRMYTVMSGELSTQNTNRFP